jgi:hypothetical protein
MNDRLQHVFLISEYNLDEGTKITNQLTQTIYEQRAVADFV